MSETVRVKNDVVKLVEDGTLTADQAQAVMPDDSKPSVSTLLSQPEGCCNRSMRVTLQTGDVLDLVDAEELTTEQAAAILDVPEDAVSQTLDVGADGA